MRNSQTHHWWNLGGSSKQEPKDALEKQKNTMD